MELKFIYFYTLYPSSLTLDHSHLSFVFIFGGVHLTINSYVFNYYVIQCKQIVLSNMHGRKGDKGDPPPLSLSETGTQFAISISCPLSSTKKKILALCMAIVALNK